MTKARDLASASIVPAAVSVTELGYIDGVTSAIQTQMDTKAATAATINPTIVDAKGDLIAATAADAVSRLAVGANNTVLTADSAAATGMKWAAAAGGGKVLQVVSGTTTTSTVIATTSYTNTTLTATITPTLNTSKILVLITQKCESERNAVRSYADWRLLRNETVINTGLGISFGVEAIGSSFIGVVSLLAMTLLDSPATTSSTQYRTQGRVYETTSGGTSTWNYNYISTITLLEIGA
jgi:hypothetical protein